MNHPIARAVRQRLESLHDAGVEIMTPIPEVEKTPPPMPTQPQRPPHQQSFTAPTQESTQEQPSTQTEIMPKPEKIRELLTLNPFEKMRTEPSRRKKVLNRGNLGDKMEALEKLAAKVARCKKCPGLKDRTQSVFGVGNPNAKLVFIGEGPGADEDEQGVPFVGRCGKLLTDMIQKGMQLSRDDIYICNIVRCRPPKNRNPEPSEAAACRTFLDQTLDVIGPKWICCLGAVAAQNLLDTKDAIGKMRGKVLDYNGIGVVCTYHPAYLLRSPNMKGKTWEDLQFLMKEMGIEL